MSLAETLLYMANGGIVADANSVCWAFVDGTVKLLDFRQTAVYPEWQETKRCPTAEDGPFRKAAL